MSMAYAVPRARGDEVAEDIATASSIRRYEERLIKDPASLAFAPLADLYRKAGRPREAAKLCRDGLARFPAYGTARLILAKALADDGDSEGALTEVQRILDGSPADAPAHRLAADLHRRAGHLAEALSHLRQAVTLDPTDRESQMMIEVLDTGASGPGEASGLRRLLGEDTFVTLTFGGVCLAQGLVDEAAQIFVRLLRRDPGNTVARDGLDAALRMKTQRRKGP
jgi:tetratricopeptide (TPR) repeat protein